MHVSLFLVQHLNRYTTLAWFVRVAGRHHAVQASTPVLGINVKIHLGFIG